MIKKSKKNNSGASDKKGIIYLTLWACLVYL